DGSGGAGGSDDSAAPASVGAQLAELGPFFAAGFHGPGAAVCTPWRPMAELVEDTGVLAGRVAPVRGYHASGTGPGAGGVEAGVGGSVVHLGLVARVTAPLFALAVVYGRGAPVDVRDLRWQPTLGSMFPLSLPEAVLSRGDAASAPDAVAELTAAFAPW